MRPAPECNINSCQLRDHRAAASSASAGFQPLAVQQERFVLDILCLATHSIFSWARAHGLETSVGAGRRVAWHGSHGSWFPAARITRLRSWSAKAAQGYGRQASRSAATGGCPHSFRTTTTTPVSLLSPSAAPARTASRPPPEAGQTRPSAEEEKTVSSPRNTCRPSSRVTRRSRLCFVCYGWFEPYLTGLWRSH